MILVLPSWQRLHCLPWRKTVFPTRDSAHCSTVKSWSPHPLQLDRTTFLFPVAAWKMKIDEVIYLILAKQCHRTVLKIRNVQLWFCTTFKKLLNVGLTLGQSNSWVYFYLCSTAALCYIWKSCWKVYLCLIFKLRSVLHVSWRNNNGQIQPCVFAVFSVWHLVN